MSKNTLNKKFGKTCIEIRKEKTLEIHLLSIFFTLTFHIIYNLQNFYLFFLIIILQVLTNILPNYFKFMRKYITFIKFCLQHFVNNIL